MRHRQPRGPATAKCFLFGWVAGWAAMLYLSCVLIWLAGLARVVSGAHGAAAVFAIADAVSPWAKLAIGIAIGACLLARRWLMPLAGGQGLLADGVLAAVGMALSLALLPQEWSAGFGIGLTGARFAPLASLLYLCSALLGGVLAGQLEASCRTNRSKLNDIYRD